MTKRLTLAQKLALETVLMFEPFPDLPMTRAMYKIRPQTIRALVRRNLIYRDGDFLRINPDTRRYVKKVVLSVSRKELEK